MAFIPIHHLTPGRVDWLWPGRLALGHVALFDGDPGIGKSLVTMLLTMTYEKDLCVPLVFCDHCQRAIDSAADGNYQWLWTDRPARIYFTHKALARPLKN